MAALREAYNPEQHITGHQDPARAQQRENSALQELHYTLAAAVAAAKITTVADLADQAAEAQEHREDQREPQERRTPEAVAAADMALTPAAAKVAAA